MDPHLLPPSCPLFRLTPADVVVARERARLLAIAGGVAAGIAALIGGWVFLNEASYASENPGSSLAGVLQATGAGIFLVGRHRSSWGSDRRRGCHLVERTSMKPHACACGSGLRFSV
jgi:hypothetical protein